MSEQYGWPSVCCDYGKEPEVKMKPIDITRTALRILGEKMKESADVLWPTERDIDFERFDRAYGYFDQEVRIGDTVQLRDKSTHAKGTIILSTQTDLEEYKKLFNPTSGEH